MTIFLIVVIILVAMFDVNTILKNQNKKTYIIYFSLLGVGFFLNYLLIIDKAPQSPVVFIEEMVRLFIGGE